MTRRKPVGFCHDCGVRFGPYQAHWVTCNACDSEPRRARAEKRNRTREYRLKRLQVRLAKNMSDRTSAELRVARLVRLEGEIRDAIDTVSLEAK